MPAGNPDFYRSGPGSSLRERVKAVQTKRKKKGKKKKKK